MERNCAPLVTDLFLYCYEYSKLQKTRLSTHLLVYSTITVDISDIYWDDETMFEL